eukprot:3096927-Pyramimonas_sp.AAC.1
MGTCGGRELQFYLRVCDEVGREPVRPLIVPRLALPRWLPVPEARRPPRARPWPRRGRRPAGAASSGPEARDCGERARDCRADAATS